METAYVSARIIRRLRIFYAGGVVLPRPSTAHEGGDAIQASELLRGGACGGESWRYNASGVEFRYLFDNPRVITRG